MNRISKVALAALALAGAGCANLNSINHRFKPDNGDSVSIDAKQRVVYSINKIFGNEKAWRAVCAEPSPDALSALSTATGIDASTLGKALGLALSTQEGAASIGLRTQSIQIPRDAMYRLCEGYASGALDDISFSRLQRRFQAVMLGLLAIEQLTGTVTAGQVTLGGQASTRLGQGLATITTSLQAAREEAEAAKAASASAKSALKVKVDEEAKAGQAVQTAIKEDGSEDTPKVKELKDKQALAGAAKVKAEADATKAAQRVNVADAEVASLDNLRKEIDRATAIASVNASVAPAGARGGPPDAKSYEAVAKVVGKIIQDIIHVDYSKESCIDTLLSRQVRVNTEEAVDALELQMKYCLMVMAINPGDGLDKSTKAEPDKAAGTAMLGATDQMFQNLRGRVAARAEAKRAAEAASAAKGATK